MPFINLVELVKQAREAGFSAEDINLLVAKEEQRYKQEVEREEKQIERDERQREREAKRLERQEEEAEKQRVHEIALARLRADGRESSSSSGNFPGLKLLRFQDGKDEIDYFLKRFERMAKLHKWEPSSYHIYIGSLLSGKALTAYVALPDDIVSDYEKLKEALLRAYNVDVDSYRKKFRET